MTIYAKIKEGTVIQYPYDFYQLRQDNPNTSFPLDMSVEQYAKWDIYPVTVEEKPSFDAIYKELSTSTPTLIDGVWTQGWTLLDRNSTQIEESIELEKTKIRKLRTSLLMETDFYGFSDITMSSEMATYRQALRDVPSQEEFPTTIVWPTKPE